MPRPLALIHSGSLAAELQPGGGVPETLTFLCCLEINPYFATLHMICLGFLMHSLVQCFHVLSGAHLLCICVLPPVNEFSNQSVLKLFSKISSLPCACLFVLGLAGPRTFLGPPWEGELAGGWSLLSTHSAPQSVPGHGDGCMGVLLHPDLACGHWPCVFCFLFFPQLFRGLSGVVTVHHTSHYVHFGVSSRSTTLAGQDQVRWGSPWALLSPMQLPEGTLRAWCQQHSGFARGRELYLALQGE